ncbi:MAG: hypothetical protein AB7O24_08570 [Kofleriaceae bacterium]
MKQTSAVTVVLACALAAGCQGGFQLGFGSKTSGRSSGPFAASAPAGGAARSAPQAASESSQPTGTAQQVAAAASATGKAAVTAPDDHGTPCHGYDRRDHEAFCTKWDEAYKAYGDGEWETVVERGAKAKSIGPGHPGIDQIMAVASDAIKRGDTGMYRHLLTGCPREVDLGWPTAAYEALRCSNTKRSPYADPDGGRRALRQYLNDETHELETTRALYVHLCALTFKRDEADDDPPYPERVLGCAWQADNLNWAKLTKEWAPQASRNAMLATVKDNIAYIRQRAQALYPKGTRDYAIFYDLRTRISNEHAEWRKQNAAALTAIATFKRNLQAGNLAGCERELTSQLTSQLASTTLIDDETSLKRELSKGARAMLVETLARCYFHTDRVEQATALMHALQGVKVPASAAQKLYAAQMGELGKDDEKAEKMPHMRGKQLSLVSGKQLEEPILPSDKLDELWRKNRPTGAWAVSGVVRAIKPLGGGRAQLLFKGRIGQQAIEHCTETNKIEKIERDGTLVYKANCRVVGSKAINIEQDPVVVASSEGVRVGAYVSVLTGVDVVFSIASKKGGKLERLAGIKLGR